MRKNYKFILISALSLSLPTASLLASSDNSDGYEEESRLSMSGFFRNETSFYLKDKENVHDKGDLLKFENTVNLDINYKISDESKIHAQTNFIYDTKAISGYKGHRINTQNDYLRELYLDTRGGDWEFRIGKQQLAWGTADGVKFLDIINPTDYREWGQNSMEDSRIPLWMVKAEKRIGDGDSTLQLVFVPDIQKNEIAGLYNPETGDFGQPFVSKGADTMTGKYNGFYNIAKDMGKTSSMFNTLLNMGGLSGLTGPMKYRTVGFFTSLNTTNNMTFADVQNMIIGASSAVKTANTNNTNLTISPAGNGTTLKDGFKHDFQNDAQVSDYIKNCFSGTDTALVNAIFIPMANMYGSGNGMLNAVANNGTGMFNNFQSYMGTLQQAYIAGKDISFTATGATIVNAGTGTLSNSEIGTALNSLGTMMYQQVAMGMGFDPTDQATQMKVATALKLDPTSATFQQDFNSKIQELAISGLSTVFTTGTTNQFDGTLSEDNPTSAFDYMGNTAFGTFKYFQNMNTVYRKEIIPEEFKNSNFGMRWKGQIGSSTNYSINYYHHWDSNPSVDLHWEDKNGRNLTPNFVTHDAVPVMYPDGSFGPTDMNGDGTPEKVTALESMKYSDGSTFDPDKNGSANLVFTERQNRINSIGASFDTTIDTAVLPIVVRGEFLYETGVKTPIVDRLKLSYGDLAGALYMRDANFIKAVLGFDVTVLTNLFLSFQYMNVRNLDYVDKTVSYNGKSYAVYTGNPATMHLSNGLKQAEKNQQMYTFFVSKPFLEGDLLRVNNLTLLEGEDGGLWNRFDMEYTATDNLLLRIEHNYYGNDENGIFGQFADMSSFQVGLKYLF